jgi:hypothetical protein
MSEFRLTQISDTHLARRLPTLTDNFHRVSEYIDANRPTSSSTAATSPSLGRPIATISNSRGVAHSPSGRLPLFARQS